jgi:hypothetical protein
VTAWRAQPLLVPPLARASRGQRLAAEAACLSPLAAARPGPYKDVVHVLTACPRLQLPFMAYHPLALVCPPHLYFFYKQLNQLLQASVVWVAGEGGRGAGEAPIQGHPLHGSGTLLWLLESLSEPRSCCPISAAGARVLSFAPLLVSPSPPPPRLCPCLAYIPSLPCWSWLQFWVHTELIGKLWWPIELILVTPSHHRVHHARNYGRK